MDENQSNENSVKKVSKKKIVFVQLDEEITTIFEKVEKLPYKEIYLVVPKRAAVLQSVVNLKILKQKLEEIDKKLAIITNDQNGMKLAHLAEIKVYDHWQIGEKNGSGEKNEGSTLLKPVAASSNEIEDDSPSRLPQKKSSIFEVVRDKKSEDKGFSLKTYLKERKVNRDENATFRINMPASTKKLLAGILALSLAVFFLIAYVALPGATVNIVPASDVVTKAINVDIMKNPTNDRSLLAISLSSDSELTISHHASGFKSEGANASGNIIVHNDSTHSQPLIKSTRFQTVSGIVFRIQQDIEVPAGETLEVYVIADAIDANGQAVGDRGNIGPSRFFLPALQLQASKDEIYGESTAYMTGGITEVTTFVTEDDITAAGQKLETALKEAALSALRKEALAKSNELNKTLALLEDSDVIQYATAKINFPRDIINKELESFEISGSLSISGVAYDRDALLTMLKNEIASTKTPGKQLIKIDENSVSINVFEVNNNSLIYKLTAQIQGIEEYEINPELEGGSKLAKKIKEHIAGKSKEEAEAYIENLPEVNTVEIKIWPVWSPTIPSLADNIKIKSVSQGDAITE